MRTIKPITFPLNEGIATQLEVEIYAFSTTATTVTTRNRLYTEEGVLLSEWVYELTETQYAAWGADNSVVEEFVAADKGIEII
jgi:hypothetical protein